MFKPPLNQPEKPADQFRLLNRCISNQTTFAFPHNQWFDIFYSLNFALFSPHCLLGFRLSGSPSGHAMGSAGVGNVMVTAVLSIVAARKLPPLQYRSVWDICALSSRLKALISHTWQSFLLADLCSWCSGCFWVWWSYWCACLESISQPISHTKLSVELFQVG